MDHFYYLKSDFVQRLGEIKQTKSMAAVCLKIMCRRDIKCIRIQSSPVIADTLWGKI